MTAPDARALLDELEKLRAAVPDPADVEKAARALWGTYRPEDKLEIPWVAAASWQQRQFLRMAAAALAAVRPSPDSEAVADALRLIDRHGCENVTGGRRCWDVGRTRGAQYGADAWCAPCIARAALGTGDREGR